MILRKSALFILHYDLTLLTKLFNIVDYQKYIFIKLILANIWSNHYPL